MTARPARAIEYVLVVALLLLAFFFRAHELAGLGLGLEHDEVAEWLIADGIRSGEHALFFEEAYGQEPLFLYWMSGSISLIGDNVMAIRFTSVFVAMLALAAAYRLLRRLFNPTVALIALAGMSIALWPVFWGRVGLRATMLPLVLCIGFDWLWRGLTAAGRGRRSFVWAGVFVGLSAYTYLSSRAVPILIGAFGLYLILFARERWRDRWRGFALFVGVAALVALPIALAILANPDLQFRVAEVSEPLDRAMAGDWNEVAANVPRAVGMFTVQGDGTVRDNWPGRPVFPEPIAAGLFLGGALIALARFRRPNHALALIWIGAMLIPTIVTSGAPNFTRTLGALPMVFALPGIAVDWLSGALAKAWPPGPKLLAVGLIAVLAINAASTHEDYFDRWPAHPETQFVFQADLAAIAKDIDASGVTDVAVAGLSNETMDDPSLYLLRRRKDVHVRWFDPGSPISSGGAMLVASGHVPYVVYVPSIVPVASELLRLARLGPEQPFEADGFRRYTPVSLLPNGLPFRDARYFDDTAVLVRAGPIEHTVRAGSELRFTSLWVAREPIAYPRRVFVHLVDPATGQVIAQHDGLDAPTRFWQERDEIEQVHVLPIPADTPPGRYELRAGLYDPLTGTRVMQTDVTGSEPISDHVVLGTLAVTQ